MDSVLLDAEVDRRHRPFRQDSQTLQVVNTTLLGPNSNTRKQFVGDLLPVWLSGLEDICEPQDHLHEPPLKVV